MVRTLRAELGSEHGTIQRQAALPDGWPSGTPEDALDTACGLYLGDPTAWLGHPLSTSGDTH